MGIKRVLLFLLMTCCASHFVSAQVVLRDTAHIFPKAPPGRSGVQQAPGADAPFEGIVTLAEAGEVRLRMNCANAPWPWWFGPPIFTGAVSPTDLSDTQVGIELLPPVEGYIGDTHLPGDLTDRCARCT
jgi:hypothetical protein